VRAAFVWASRLVSAAKHSARNVREIRPTTRYMNLLVTGAAEHGLPAAWIEVLRSFEAIEEKAEAAALRPFFDRAMRRTD
jgi:hypothetical protein